MDEYNAKNRTPMIIAIIVIGLILTIVYVIIQLTTAGRKTYTIDEIAQASFKNGSTILLDTTEKADSIHSKNYDFTIKKTIDNDIKADIYMTPTILPEEAVRKHIKYRLIDVASQVVISAGSLATANTFTPVLLIEDDLIKKDTDYRVTVYTDEESPQETLGFEATIEINVEDTNTIMATERKLNVAADYSQYSAKQLIANRTPPEDLIEEDVNSNTSNNSSSSQSSQTKKVYNYACAEGWSLNADEKKCYKDATKVISYKCASGLLKDGVCTRSTKKESYKTCEEGELVDNNCYKDVIEEDESGCEEGILSSDKTTCTTSTKSIKEYYCEVGKLNSTKVKCVTESTSVNTYSCPSGSDYEGDKITEDTVCQRSPIAKNSVTTFVKTPTAKKNYCYACCNFSGECHKNTYTGQANDATTAKFTELCSTTLGYSYTGYITGNCTSDSATNMSVLDNNAEYQSSTFEDESGLKKNDLLFDYDTSTNEYNSINTLGKIALLANEEDTSSNVITSTTCTSGWNYNEASKMCEKAPTPKNKAACPESFTLSSVDKKCYKSAQHNTVKKCDDDWKYNDVNKNCEKEAVVSARKQCLGEGWKFKDNQCVKTAKTAYNLVCLDGWTMQGDKCVQNPVEKITYRCSEGFKVNETQCRKGAIKISA